MPRARSHTIGQEPSGSMAVTLRDSKSCRRSRTGRECMVRVYRDSKRRIQVNSRQLRKSSWNHEVHETHETARKSIATKKHKKSTRIQTTEYSDYTDGD